MESNDHISTTTSCRDRASSSHIPITSSYLPCWMFVPIDITSQTIATNLSPTSSHKIPNTTSVHPTRSSQPSESTTPPINRPSPPINLTNKPVPTQDILRRTHSNFLGRTTTSIQPATPEPNLLQPHPKFPLKRETGQFADRCTFSPMMFPSSRGEECSGNIASAARWC